MCGIVHFTLSIYIDEIAFHQNSLPAIFHRGSYLLAKYVFIRSWKKTWNRNFGSHLTFHSLNSSRRMEESPTFTWKTHVSTDKFRFVATNFRYFMFVKPFARLLHHFSINRFYLKRVKFLFLPKTTWQIRTRKKEKNTCSIFGVLGILLQK